MRIRRLKLSGFKSFVEPATLSIEPGLTGEATAGVKGAVWDIEEARQILQIVIDVWVGDFLHPGRG